MKKNKRYKRRRRAAIKRKQFSLPNKTIIYKREKNSCEISGPARSVKSLILLDLISNNKLLKFASGWIFYFFRLKDVLIIWWWIKGFIFWLLIAGFFKYIYQRIPLPFHTQLIHNFHDPVRLPQRDYDLLVMQDIVKIQFPAFAVFQPFCAGW